MVVRARLQIGSHVLNSNRSAATKAAAQRGQLDTIISSAMVDVFRSCGVAVAPRAARDGSGDVRIPDVSAAIGFSLRQGDDPKAIVGRLTLSVPDDLFTIMRVQGTKPLQLDLIRELTNQLAARIKHRLLPFDAALQPALPGLLSRMATEVLKAKSPGLRVYCGRTLRGEVVVTLEGEIDESRLVYSGAADVANEGDVIVF